MANVTSGKKTDLERIREWYYTGSKKELPARAAEMHERCIFAQGLFLTGESKVYVINALQDKYGIGKSQAYLIADNSVQLFGDLNKVSKEGKKEIIGQMILEDIKKSREAGDLETAEKLYGKYCRMFGLYETEGRIDLTQINLPQTIIYTDHPSALHANG